MSITRVKPGRGIWVKCDGTDERFCPEKRYTGNIVPKHNRAYWASTEGWGRGPRSRSKRWDLCPTHLEHERQVKAKQDAEKQARKEAKKLTEEQRAAARAAKKAERAAAKAAKEADRQARKLAKASASASTSSPSADSALAPAT